MLRNQSGGTADLKTPVHVGADITTLPCRGSLPGLITPVDGKVFDSSRNPLARVLVDHATDDGSAGRDKLNIQLHGRVVRPTRIDMRRGRQIGGLLDRRKMSGL